MGDSRTASGDAAGGRFGEVRFVQLFAAFFVLSWAIYSPALDGAFVSDDGHYVVDNYYIHELTTENLLAILSPWSALPLAVENYAPVHLLLHALEWQLFGSDVRGYHVVNLAVHALASCLLISLFRRSGVPALAALIGGLFFLVHPGNVESVAWISQLKTTSAMVLMLGALLCSPRRPALGAALFALALLAKPTAAVGLFFGGVVLYVSQGRGAEQGIPPRAQWRWLGVWAAIFVLFSIAEASAFANTAGTHPEIYPNLTQRLLSTLAISLRYLVMAMTSWGLSTFHEPAPTTSLLDPWLLGALAAITLIAWRALWCLRARRMEAAFWAWAVVSWAPISGLIPLPFPLTDRYLYFILPGLIGAALLGGPDALAWTRSRWPALSRTTLVRALGVVAIVWIAAFAWRSHVRAYVWQSPTNVAADSERHYPDGSSAKINAAIRAAEQGDVETAVARLREANARGFDSLDQLLSPLYRNIQGQPAFVALQREWAHAWVARYSQSKRPQQPQLMLLTQAYIVLGDYEAARRAMMHAIYAGGPRTEYIRASLGQLDALEAQQAAKSRGAGATPDGSTP